MIRKISVVVAAFACIGLIIIFAPGFAPEIAAGVVSVGKFHAGTAADHSIGSPQAGCPSDPWPYGCDWRTSSPEQKKKVARNDRNRRNHHGLTIVRGNGFSANDAL